MSTLCVRRDAYAEAAVDGQGASCHGHFIPMFTRPASEAVSNIEANEIRCGAAQHSTGNNAVQCKKISSFHSHRKAGRPQHALQRSSD